MQVTTKREIGSMEAEFEKIEDLIDGVICAGSETRVRLELEPEKQERM